LITRDDIDVVVSALRRGVSLEGAAALTGRSKTSLYRERIADPALDAELMRAAALHETELVDLEWEAIQSGNAATASQASAILLRRYPQRHGSSVLRESRATAHDAPTEDLAATVGAPSAPSEALARVIERVLSGE